MASRRKKVAKAVPFNTADLANITKANPYLQRLIEDSGLRDNIRTTTDSARSAYNRLNGSKAPEKALLEDKKLQGDISQAAQAFRDATLALTNAPNYKAKKKGKGLGRTLLVLLIGAGAAVAASEKLRSKVLDTLFGAEEEFQYTPPVGSTTTPPASPVTAA